VIAAVGCVALSGCGGDADDGSGADGGAVEDQAPAGADAAADPPDEEDFAAAQDLADKAVADTSADAKATVVIDGTAYEFRALEPGPDEDFWSLCTTMAGSLQGTMQLVDDDGAHVEEGELMFVLLEPGAAYDLGAEVEFTIPEFGTAVYDRSFRADEIDATVSGRSGSGSFTATNVMGDRTITGTIEATC